MLLTWASRIPFANELYGSIKPVFDATLLWLDTARKQCDTELGISVLWALFSMCNNSSRLLATYVRISLISHKRTGIMERHAGQEGKNFFEEILRRTYFPLTAWTRYIGRIFFEKQPMNAFVKCSSFGRKRRDTSRELSLSSDL